MAQKDGCAQCKVHDECMERFADNQFPSCATEAMEALKQAYNNARDEICPHYHKEYSVNEESVGEFGIGICTCDGQTSPVA